MTIGIIGWKGMVGNILLNKLLRNKLVLKNKIILLTRNKEYKKKGILNINNDNIKKCDVIVCSATANLAEKIKKITKKLKIILLDLSSKFRRKKYSTLVLDPINKKDINKNLKKDKILSGCNCVTAILLIAIMNLMKNNKIIDNIYNTTLQSISGAGVNNTIKLIKDTKKICCKIKNINNKSIRKNFCYKNYKINKLNLPMSIINWIGNNKKKPEEEEKCYNEIKKIYKKKININTNCIRVNTIRCHSMSIIIKFKSKIKRSSIIKKTIKNNKYISIIKNNKNKTIEKLNPVFISGKKNIFLGRIKKLNKKTISMIIIGDQLLWGAVEPIKRTLISIINDKI